MMFLSGVAYVRPARRRPVFLKGGAGAGAYRALAAGDGADLSYLGLGVQLGVGYDVRVSDRFTLTPQVGVLATSFGSLDLGDARVARDVSMTLFQVGLVLVRQ